MEILSFENSYPYTLEDISVVIPHASQYKRRLVWFLRQYCHGTPDEVIKRTYLIYDEGDEFTTKELKKYPVLCENSMETKRPHMIYKLEAGFQEVKTRLVIRMHNDCRIRRGDYLIKLLEIFNQNESMKLIGDLHRSGGIDSQEIVELRKYFPYFKVNGDTLNGIPAHFLHGFFMAAQTPILRDTFKNLVKFKTSYKGSDPSNKEDVIISQLFSFNNIKVEHWVGIWDYLIHTGTRTNDFENNEEDQIPLPSKII